MKLFKISFISVISIFIFQSQLYGINLSCDFKQILNDKNELNGITCRDNDHSKKHGHNCRVKSEDDYHQWISEVIIKNKDVVIMDEQSNYQRGKTNNKQKREYRERSKERGLIVESVVHHKNEWSGDDKIDRYIFVIKDCEVCPGGPSKTYNYLLYTLFFNNISKQSILTQYNSIIMSGDTSDWSETHFGECEVLD